MKGDNEKKIGAEKERNLTGFGFWNDFSIRREQSGLRNLVYDRQFVKSIYEDQVELLNSHSTSSQVLRKIRRVLIINKAISIRSPAEIIAMNSRDVCNNVPAISLRNKRRKRPPMAHSIIFN